MNNPIIKASGAIPAYACVKVSTSGSERVEVAASAADVVFGVTLAGNTESGAAVDFQTTDSQLDIFTLKAAGTIGIGQYVVPTTNGTVAAATTGPFVALDPATIGQTFTARKFNAGATANFLAPGTNAITRTLDSKLTDTLSVKDFGATGNGSTDDTVAIQAALTAGAGKSVYFPVGTYITSAGLNVSANTYVYGDGGTANISVQPTASAATYNQGLVITGSGITIDGLKISGTNEYSLVGGVRTEYASAISLTSGTARNIDILDCQIFGWGWGMYLRRVSNYRIVGNRCWGGNQTGTDVPTTDNTCWDISVNSSAEVEGNKGRRGIIANNFCLSNVDSFIGVGANSAADKDIIIHNNVVQPLQTDGLTALANVDNKSRYGIHVGYGGTEPLRVVVSGNIVRDISITGIYLQGASMPTGDVAITGNMVSNCAFNTNQPAFRSLKGGIYAIGGADSISGNVIVDCYTAGIVYTTLQDNPSPAGVQLPRSVIANNNISRILTDPNNLEASGYGISLTGYNNSRILVSSNRIQKTAHQSISSIVINNNADNGGIHIVGNLVEVAHALGAILVNQGGASVSQSSVTSNHVVGSDNTTNTSANVGIWINGKVHCVGNTVRNFSRGIQASSITTRIIDVQCSSNAIANCAYAISGGSDDALWLVTANTFTGTTTRDCHAGVYQGVLFKSSHDSQTFVVQITRNAVPWGGTWAVGDYCKNTAVAVGQPKGWYCTVAGIGAAATWVSEGNL